MADLDWLFNPRSIAIIGASSDKTKLGGRPVHFLKEFGFAGSIYPVNPHFSEIQGLPAFSRIGDIHGDVDQAVIVVPAPLVGQAVRDCAAKGVKIIQILTSGFAEAGEDGLAAQARIVSIAKRANIRIVGPNSLGAVSPSNGVFTTFSSSLAGLRPKAGNLAFVTQSGAFGSCAYVMASLRGMGLSRVIATGNESDVDVAECIEYLVEDPETEVICVAMETCKNGDRFRRALRMAAIHKKPVLVMKVGTTDVGASAAATHTGSLAGNDAVYDAVFRECGAFRAGSIEEMIDTAYVLLVGSMPSNNEVEILTRSGGIGILMADAAIEMRLSLPKLPVETRRRIAELLPIAQGDNPLDTTAQVVTSQVTVADLATEILRDSDLGSVVLYLGHTALAPSVFKSTEESLIELKSRFPDTLIVCVMPSAPQVREALEASNLPVFEDRTRAIKAISAASTIRNGWDLIADWDLIGESTHHTANAVASLPDVLNEASAKDFLSAWGIAVLRERLCVSVGEAGEAADEIGYPIVAKIVSPDIAHKSDMGGVILNLLDRVSVERAYVEVVTRAHEAYPSAQINGVLIAPMTGGGLATILGVHYDDVFGPMIMFGLGGVMVELFNDVAFASAPISSDSAERLISTVKGARLLEGWRGSGPLDRQALVRAICSLSILATRSDEIASIDINPFVIFKNGAVALDASMLRKE